MKLLCRLACQRVRCFVMPRHVLDVAEHLGAAGKRRLGATPRKEGLRTRATGHASQVDEAS